MALAPGTSIGKWTITGEPFGKGGNARVYPVTSDVGDLGAIKLLQDHRLDSEPVGRFRQEIQTLQRIAPHPNVVRLLDASPDSTVGKDLWYVMEPVTGGSLRSNRGVFIGKLEPAYSVMIKAAEGVEHLHANKVIHRDLKPDNILLRADGSPVVSDLGLCWLTDFSGAQRLTPEERETGAWGFRAPEHEHSRVEDVKESADCFSLAKILWWLVYGGAPFASGHYESEKFDLVRKFNSTEMAVVTALLGKTMQAEPDRRLIKTAANLTNELRFVHNALREQCPDVKLAVSANVDKKRSAAELEKARKILDTNLHAAFPPIWKQWKEALVRLKAEVDKAYVEKNATTRLIVFEIFEDAVKNPLKGPPRMGFSIGDFRFQFEVKVSSSDHGLHYSQIGTSVFLNGGRTERLGHSFKFTLQPAGGGAVLVRNGEPGGVPANPDLIWREAFKSLLR